MDFVDITLVIAIISGVTAVVSSALRLPNPFTAAAFVTSMIFFLPFSFDLVSIAMTGDSEEAQQFADRQIPNLISFGTKAVVAAAYAMVVAPIVAAVAGTILWILRRK